MTLDLQALLADICDLVAIESPTENIDRCNSAIAWLRGRASHLHAGIEAETVSNGGREHLILRKHGNRIDAAPLIVGHVDTVWPVGTADRLGVGRRVGAHPGIGLTGIGPAATGPDEHGRGLLGHSEIRHDAATQPEGDYLVGPGVFDMKAGLICALYALAGHDGAATMLITTDEETGSHTSRELVRALATASCGALVCEGPVDGPAGTLKSARKGASMYRLVVHGRASHSGLAPEAGVNALTELAHQLLTISGLGDLLIGTTVVPTTAHAGTAENVVPERAEATIDVRAVEPAEQHRVEHALRSLTAVTPGAHLELLGTINRPPLTDEATAPLVHIAQKVCEERGLAWPGAMAVGGASDGNFIGVLGVPVLDGLGPPGGGAHADHEHVLIDGLAPRITLISGMLAHMTLNATNRGERQRSKP